MSDAGDRPTHTPHPTEPYRPDWATSRIAAAGGVGNGFGDPALNGKGSLRELTRSMLRRYRLIAAIWIVAVVLVTVYVFLATPLYESKARLRIETKSASGSVADQISATLASSDANTSNIVGGGGGGGAAAGAGAGGAAAALGLGRDELLTDVAVLRSDRVLDGMIDSLALGVRVAKPAESRAAVLTARTVDPSMDIDGGIDFIRQGDGTYSLKRHKLDEVPVLPEVLAPGKALRVGGFEVTLQPRLKASGPEEIVVKFLPRFAVYKLLEKRLLIARQEGGSRLVEISFEDPDRVLAQQVVNGVVETFRGYTGLTDESDDTATVTRLRFQVDSTHQSLVRAEVALRGFQEQSRTIVPDEQASAQVKRISAISGRLDDISTERRALSRMLEIIQGRFTSGAGSLAYRELATFPSLINNRAIQDLLSTVVDLESKRAQLSVTRTPDNDEYRSLTDRINQVERQLYTTGSQYLESLDQELNTTVGTVTALSDTLATMPAVTMQYGRLLRDRTVLEATYVAMDKELRIAQLRDVLRRDRVKVIDAPRVAYRKDIAFPKKAVMMVLGAIFGMALALTVVLAIELWQGP